MLSVNCYAKIKEVEDKGNYSIVKISVSKKNKQSGKYETDFIGNVNFVGQSHLQRPLKDQRIKITSFGVQNCYTKDGNLEFLKSPRIAIFSYELQEDNSTKSLPPIDLDISDNELPF